MHGTDFALIHVKLDKLNNGICKKSLPQVFSPLKEHGINLKDKEAVLAGYPKEILKEEGG